MKFSSAAVYLSLFIGSVTATSPNLRGVTRRDDDAIDAKPVNHSTHRGLATSCSAEKKIKIYKFCINGDDDAGSHGEHQIRLDGQKYFPNRSSDCAQDPTGYCAWREGQCHNLDSAPYKEIPAFKSLTVGTEEHDTTSQNDSYYAALSSNDWYNPTCETYEVQIAKQFSAATQKSLCWNVGASASNGGAEINAGIQSCSTWTEPAESYVWYMRVEPVTKTESPTCSSPKVYKTCGSCRKTCADPNPEICTASCRQGCFCPDDMLEDANGNCVFAHQCPTEEKAEYFSHPSTACRTQQGGMGTAGVDYYNFNTNDCQGKCDSMGDQCKAFESGSGGHCEIWTYRPPRTERRSGYTCHIQGPKGFSTPATYNTNDPAACRTSTNGMGSVGTDYLNYSGLDEQECKQLCDQQGSLCGGYESGAGGHCEIWSKKPQNVERKTGYKCGIKAEV